MYIDPAVYKLLPELEVLEIETPVDCDDGAVVVVTLMLRSEVE